MSAAMKNPFVRKLCFLLTSLPLWGLGGFGGFNSVYAQQPVQITAFTINPPYSSLVSDYITGFNQRVTLVMTAPTRTDIRLAGTLKSNTGVSITVPAQLNYFQQFRGQPISVQGQKRVTGADVGNLFSGNPTIDNSTVALKRDLIGNYILPEGDYEVCIRAYAFNGPNALSDEVCAQFSLRNVEPPYLLSPADKDPMPTASATYQPVQFLWTFPAGANPTHIEYVLQIAELREGQNPYNVFESGPPFAEIVVPNASPLYILKPTDPRFEIGRAYAWRVRVRGKGRFEGTVNFENNGLSTVNTFTYGPTGSNLVTSSEKVVKGKPKADSSAATFTPVSGSCSCKIAVSTNMKLRTDLDNSQTVYIGNREGYQLSISRLEKNETNNTYSGDGTVALGLDFTPTGRSGPFIPVQVAFKDVKINTDNILIAGQVQSKKRQDIGFGPQLAADPTAPSAPGLPATSDLKNWLLKSADEKSLAPAWKGLKDKIVGEYDSYKQQAVQQANQQVNGAGIATPFGYSSGVFTVAVDNIQFTPTTAQYDAFSVLEVSDANLSVPLGLMGACLPLAGCQSQPVLYLLKDTDIPYTAQTLTLKGGTDPANSTYLAYKANGSDNVLNIVADVSIPDATLVEGGAPVTARLVANTKDGFDNWQAKASIAGAFRFSGLDDFTFKLGNGAVYDHDINHNTDGFGEALTALQSSLVADKSDAATKLALLRETAWQGFFMPELSVTLPTLFQKTDGKTTTTASVTVRNMMLGKSLGLTGVLNAENVINYKEGSLDGWYFSLDKIGITFFDGTFVKASADGKIGLPISDNNVQSALTYTNLMSHDSVSGKLAYLFKITPINAINVPIWKAGITLKESSVISVSVTGTDVLAKADLNGNITFSPDFGILPDFKLDLIDVEHLVVQSKAPYFSIGESKSEAYQKGKALVQQADAFAGKFASPQKSVGGSPFTVDAFTPVVQPGQGDVKVKAGFYFHGSMDLADMPLSPKAGVGLVILANVKMDGIRPSFSYDRTELEDAQVSGQLGPLAVDGSLKFYRDSKDKDLPGNGFKGNLSTKVGSYSIVGQSIFGRGDFPYWYFYLAGSGSPGLFQVGPVTVNGLGGGLFHNMTPPKPDPNATFEKQPKTDNYDYAASQGTDGLKMAMYFSVASQYILNARATLEGSMKNGELNTISVQGPGNLIGGTDGKSLLQANVLAMYDFPQKIFSLDADVKGGMTNVLEIKSAQLAVRADFKQDKYTLKIGEPTHRVQLELLSGLADATGYFMVGNADIPDIPEPDPSIISQESMAAFKKMGYRSPIRAADASFDTKGADNDAAGLAFGATLRAGANVDWTIFWAKFKAGAGFDVNFKRQAVVCEENPKQLIGANGWYVQGQAYAEFQGGVGVSAPFVGDVTIVDLKAAALLQAGLPSPTYFQGFVHGEAHVLGIFDGTFDLPVSIGTPCTPVANPFSNKPLMAGFNIDANNSGNVDILLNPQVTLNYPNKFRVDGISSNGEAFGHDYEIRVKTTLSPTAVGEQYYNDNKVLYRLNDAFQPKKGYTIGFHAVAYQDNDFSKPYQFPDRKGRLVDIKQDTTFSFTTGPCVGKIDERSLAYAFPYQQQAYYLQGESNSSTVRLKKAIGCLFDPKKVKTEIVITPRKSPSRDAVAPAQSVRVASSTVNTTKAVLTSPATSPTEIRVPVTFDGNQLTYTMPTLPNNTDVQVQVVQQPVIPPQLTAFAQKSAQQASLYGNLYVSAKTVAIPENTSSSVVSANSSAYTASVVRSPVSKQLVVEQPVGKVILSYGFHTSRYNSLTDKLAAINVPANGSAGINPDHGIEIYFSSKEGFDGYDANDYPYDNNGVAAVNPALVNVLEQNNRWYEQTVKPLNKQWINLQDQLRKSPVYQAYNTLELIDNEHIQLVPDGQLHLFNTRVWEIVDNRLGVAKNTANWVKASAADYHKWVDDKYHSDDNQHWWGVDHTYNTIRGWNEKGDKPNHMFHRLLIAAGDNISPASDYNPYPFGDFNYLKTNINTLLGFDGMRSLVTMLPLTPTLIFGYTDPTGKGKTSNIRKTYTLR